MTIFVPTDEERTRSLDEGMYGKVYCCPVGIRKAARRLLRQHAARRFEAPVIRIRRDALDAFGEGLRESASHTSFHALSHVLLVHSLREPAFELRVMRELHRNRRARIEFVVHGH